MIYAMIRRFLRDERGATVVEYAVLCMVITVMLITAVATIGDDLSAMLLGAQAGFN